MALVLDIDRLSRVSELIDGWSRQGILRGAAVAVSRSTGSTWVHTAGTADTLEGAEPVTAEHRFLLTSVTKPFTATQVLTLVDEGSITLRTPVAEIVPAFAANGKKEVLVWHLLTHTSGLDDTHANTTEGPPAPLDFSFHLEAACNAPLARPPGTHVEYCSPPFWVMTEIVQQVTGTPYAEHLKERLLVPCGLDSTDYWPGEDPPEKYVLPGAIPAERQHLAEQVRRLAYPAGGLIGTVGDLVTFGRVWLHDGRTETGARLLSPLMVETTASGWTEGLPGYREYEQVGWRTERGLGWALGGPGDLRSAACLWHSGGSGTSIWIDRQHDLIVVLLSATWFLDYSALHRTANAAFAALVQE